MTTKLTRSALLSFAEDVADNLPGTWAVSLFPEDWGRVGAWLTNPTTQARLSIGESQNYADRKKDILHISTDYPKDRDGQTSSAKRPSINVGAMNLPSKVARDIERRLFPEYLPILEREVASLRGRERHEDATRGLAAQIARLVRAKHDPDEETVSFYHSPYRVFHETMSQAHVVGSDDVELTLRLDPDTAATVLKLLIDLRG